MPQALKLYMPDSFQTTKPDYYFRPVGAWKSQLWRKVIAAMKIAVAVMMAMIAG